MDTSNLMTLKDIAVELDLPESTLRKYRDAYPQFIPTVGSGRDRRYPPEASDVFMAIRKYRAYEHLSWEDTGKELATQFKVNQDMVDGDGLPRPDRVPVSAQAAALLRRIEKKTDDQSFLVNTIGAELVKLINMMGRFSTALNDISIIRRAVFSFDNELRQVARKASLGTRDTSVTDEMRNEQLAILGRLAQLQSSVAYLTKKMENIKTAPARPMPATGPAAAPAAPEPVPAPPEKDPMLVEYEQEISRLRGMLKEREDEIMQIQATNRRLRIENDALKSRVSELSRIEPAPPTASTFKQGKQDNKIPGGKLFFRGKKK